MPSSRRIAVLGAPGQLGSDLVRAARSAGADVVALGHADVEIRDPESVEAAVAGARPDVVVDCAAYHQVDDCERDPRAAFEVNALGALHMARAARRHGGRTVYVSTDYVFDGRKPFDGPTGPASPDDAYTETDGTGPLNVYGISKLAGEWLARETDPDTLIIRTAGLFGRTGSRGKRGTNFVEQVAALVRAGSDLEVVDDQYVTPTYTVDAAAAILELIERGTTGVVHVAAEGACTWHAFATRCVELLRATNEVRRIRAADRSAIARRPSNTALCVDRLRATLGRAMRPWPEALEAYLREVGHLTS